jgi:hypothetical protein
MGKFRAVAGTTALLTIIAPSIWATERMKAGQWELTVTEGSKTHTSNECVTPEKVKAVNGGPDEVRAEIAGRAAAMGCTVQNFKMQGDTVSYTTACTTFAMDNTISYHGDAMETVTTMKGSGGPSRKVKARRLGACP